MLNNINIGTDPETVEWTGTEVKVCVCGGGGGSTISLFPQFNIAALPLRSC